MRSVTEPRGDVEGPDVVLHLVNISTPAPGAFCGNCLGANRATVQSLETSRIEMVLFVGPVEQLPHDRTAHWAAAGKLLTRAALHTLGLMIGASSVQLTDAHAKVRRELLPLIASILTLHIHRLADCCHAAMFKNPPRNSPEARPAIDEADCQRVWDKCLSLQSHRERVGGFVAIHQERRYGIGALVDRRWQLHLVRLVILPPHIVCHVP